MFGKLFDILANALKDQKSETLLAIRDNQIQALRDLVNHKTSQLFYCYVLIFFLLGLLIASLIFIAELYFH